MKRLLIVDDKAEVRFQLLRFFGLRGWEVDTATNSTEAIACLRAVVVDAIFLAVDLPDACGLTILHNIRRNSGLRDVPVVMVSISRAAPDIAAAVELGAADWLCYPISHIQMEAILDRVASQEALH